MEGTIGEMKVFAGSYAPKNWMICNGEYLKIEDNMALFSVIGTTYGGDGMRTFALPDMRGRTVIGAGRGPGLSDRKAGEKLGVESDWDNTGRAEAFNKEPIQVNVTTESNKMQPSLVANWIICVKGIYPVRDY
ncbi:phage tail protein [Roseivirga pacifica]|uniref:phage tail protein n=1 Tax=Roseivirga pacifica TaxID=1267423 RepID=UPI003BAF856F